MTHRATFHTLALAELDKVDDFIAQDSPQRAIAFVRRIRKHCEQLAEKPESSRVGTVSAPASER